MNREYKCTECGYRIKDGEIESNDSLCPNCGVDFYATNKLVKIEDE